MSKEKKLSKGRLRAIIVTGISCAVAIALIITNAFIPVKYLASYMVLRNKGAAEGTMRVRFLDVGYGDCTLIELPDGKNMLIDGGNGTSTNQSVILKNLNQCDIDTIDYLICTSVNEEHCGGLAELISYKTVKKIFMPYYITPYINDEFSQFVFAAKNSGAEIVINEYGAGEYSEIYNYFFVLISPSVSSNPDGQYAAFFADTASSEARNNISAVLWLEFAGTSFLFTSDITSSEEERISAEYRLLREVGDEYCPLGNYSIQLDRCNVVKVANHGSADSACVDFYELIKPEVAVITVGENGYGCPSGQVLSDIGLFTDNLNLYRTDKNGTVTIDVTAGGYEVI